MKKKKEKKEKKKKVVPPLLYLYIVRGAELYCVFLNEQRSAPYSAVA